MIRKHCQFFDPSVELLNTEGAHFTTLYNALEVEQQVRRFIFKASFNDYFDNFDGGYSDEFECELGDRIISASSHHRVKAKLTKEVFFDIFKASKISHRLETLFTFPWEKSGSQVMVKYRQLTLTFSFFAKSSKKPFYTMTLFWGDEEGAKIIDLTTEKIP